MASTRERALIERRLREIGVELAVPWERLGLLVEEWERFGRAMNLTGARDLPALVEHVVEGLQVVALVGRIGCAVGQRWVDVGSGAGFPGLLVAACLPLEVVMVEPRERRSAFLELMLGRLGAQGRVVRGRLEAGGWTGEARGLGSEFHWASARAVFAPGRWLELGSGVVVPGGVVVAHLGRGDVDPVGWEAVDRVDGARWSVRGYRRFT